MKGWTAKVRKNWQMNNRSRARMRAGSKEAPGIIVVGDNLGQVDILLKTLVEILLNQLLF